jgi:hypothetical protein
LAFDDASEQNREAGHSLWADGGELDDIAVVAGDEIDVSDLFARLIKHLLVRQLDAAARPYDLSLAFDDPTTLNARAEGSKARAFQETNQLPDTTPAAAMLA